MDWLRNEWVIGTGTGIVSGLLVTWLLRAFISKKKTREYRQQIASANREIVYSIRVTIPDDFLPTLDVIEAMIHSTARRYAVEAEELYSAREIIEELIKEVMDTSFLSSAKKADYCKSLSAVGNTHFDSQMASAEYPAHLMYRNYVGSSVEGVIGTESAIKAELQRKRTKSTSVERVLSIFGGVISAVGGSLLYFYFSDLRDIKLLPFVKGIAAVFLPLVLVVAVNQIVSSLQIALKRPRGKDDAPPEMPEG